VPNLAHTPIEEARQAWTVEKLAAGRIVNQISVDEETAHYASRWSAC
jgi:hypothetical protein